MIALGAFLAGDGIHYASSFASVPRLTFAVPYMAGASAGEIPWGSGIGCVTDAYVFRAVVERGRVR
ncbi:MAG: hypothetical protein LKK22_00465 [Olsenella sp.]|jgi:hypothetical protein|nr:hypothetical protein [Olsenella sp.]MCH3957518.1 hypothetical protein [Olsenella sp.]MCI1666875.1 hypothetical protein [Olsenella sp.]MCI2123978.1 hypothetical protein [Olsenella sp.]MCI2126425.1 hypothetical protein [Olsenella sp.]